MNYYKLSLKLLAGVLITSLQLHVVYAQQFEVEPSLVQSEDSYDRESNGITQLAYKRTRAPATLEHAWLHAKRMISMTESTEHSVGWFQGYLAARTGSFAPDDWLTVVSHRLSKHSMMEAKEAFPVWDLSSGTDAFTTHSNVGPQKKVFHTNNLRIATSNVGSSLIGKDDTVIVGDLSFCEKMEANVVYLKYVELEECKLVIVRSRLILDRFYIGRVKPNSDEFVWILERHGANLKGVVDTNKSNDEYLGFEIKVVDSTIVIYGWSRRQAFVSGLDVENGKQQFYLDAE